MCFQIAIGQCDTFAPPNSVTLSDGHCSPRVSVKFACKSVHGRVDRRRKRDWRERRREREREEGEGL